jgi:hypothetical protein
VADIAPRLPEPPATERTIATDPTVALSLRDAHEFLDRLRAATLAIHAAVTGGRRDRAFQPGVDLRAVNAALAAVGKVSDGLEAVLDAAGRDVARANKPASNPPPPHVVAYFQELAAHSPRERPARVRPEMDIEGEIAARLCVSRWRWEARRAKAREAGRKDSV